MENLFIIIPARLNSTRLPNKVLKKIHGKTLVQHIWEKLKDFPNVCIATDSEKIVSEIKTFKGNVILTKKSHQNGTERCNEAAEKLNLKKTDIIINVQCDELGIYHSWIKKMYHKLSKSKEEIITTITSSNIKTEDLEDASLVKVILGKKNFAHEFQRTINLNSNFIRKHVGVYGYTQNTLSKICKLKMTSREKKEKLEQLRWLENNFKIKCIETTHEGFSINTKEDLERLKRKNIL